MRFCLRPGGGHPTSDQEGLVCVEPGCGYLYQGAAIARWTIDRFLGRGPLADLYLALPTEPNAPLMVAKALRVPFAGAVTLDQHLEQRRALRHAHIHPLVAWMIQENRAILLSPLASQGSLAKTLVRDTLPGLEGLVRLVVHLADALQYAHDAQIVHGRLKPENCLLVAPDQVALSDFGHSLFTVAPPSPTAAYVAPEQFLGQLRPATDQFALASLFSRFLPGQPPTPRRASGGEVSDLFLSSSLTPGVPGAVIDVLARAFHPTPEERFPSTRVFAARLQAAFQSSAVPVKERPPPCPAPPEEPPLARRPLPPEAKTPPGKGGLTVFARLPGHLADVSALRWAAHAPLLASGSRGELRVWEMQAQTASLRASFAGPQSEILALAWSPDGAALFASGADGSIWRWDLSSERRGPAKGDTPTGAIAPHSWYGHEGKVRSLDLSPTGRWLASGGADRRVVLWDGATGKEEVSWAAHGRGGVQALAWSLDGAYLASGGADHLLHLWSPGNRGEQPVTCQGSTGPVQRLAWSPDGTVLASAGDRAHQEVVLWNPATGQIRARLAGQTGVVAGMCWSPDGAWLAVATEHQVRFWDLTSDTPHPMRTIRLPEASHTLASTPDGSLLAQGVGSLVQIYRLVE